MAEIKYRQVFIQTYYQSHNLTKLICCENRINNNNTEVKNKTIDHFFVVLLLSGKLIGDNISNEFIIQCIYFLRTFARLKNNLSCIVHLTANVPKIIKFLKFILLYVAIFKSNLQVSW